MKELWQLCGIVVFWLSWPALWIYLRGTKRTRVIVTAGDKVLLVKGWLGAGQWILPGGGTHRGENPLKAAVREVREETGIKLDPVSLKTLDTMEVREYGFRFTCVIYVADLKDAPALKPQPLEITEVAWVSRSDLANLSPLTSRLLAEWS